MHSALSLLYPLLIFLYQTLQMKAVRSSGCVCLVPGPGAGRKRHPARLSPARPQNKYDAL